MRGRRVFGVYLIAASTFLYASGAIAQTAGFIQPDIAIRAWRTRPKNNETTAALRNRVSKELRKMLTGDPRRLDDTQRWRLLAYLHDYPWQRVPARWKTWYLETMPNPRLTPDQQADLLKRIQAKPLYHLTPKELDVYLGWVQKEVPDLRARVMHYARQRVGQPYEMYLLGEFPFEIHDPQPLFNLEKSDCVVFCEHTYAMALSSNWTEFFQTLQKIRYKNGEIGILTRNHYTEADWNKNNSWLVEDVTTKLGATTVTKYRERINREEFFGKFGLGKGFPVQVLEDEYIPAQAIPSVLDKLQDGDFVNVVRGIGEGAWVGHTGLIGHNERGEVTFIHSTPPRVVEVPLAKYVLDNTRKNVERAKKGQAQFLGMKFLRLRTEELAKK